MACLGGLIGLTAIGGKLSIDNNDALTSLAGLDNIEASSIVQMHTIFNSNLDTCHVNSVCDYLAAPNGANSIFGNAAGCGDVPTILGKCELSTHDIDPGNSVSLFPNPADDWVSMVIPGGTRVKRVMVSDFKGRFFSIIGPGQILDISLLEEGLYTVRIVTDHWTATRKLVIR